MLGGAEGVRERGRVKEGRGKRDEGVTGWNGGGERERRDVAGAGG